MSFVRAGQLARETPYARPDDSLALVAENLRESHYGTIPIFDSVEVNPRKLRHETLRGVIDEGDLSRALNPSRTHAVRIGIGASGEHIEYSKSEHSKHETNGYSDAYARDASNGAPDFDQAPRLVTQLTARDAMRDVGFVPSVFSLQNALAALDRYEVNALPVIDGVQGFQGMISRSDVVAALGGQVRPPVVGGMATPLGVWLTTGSLSAGVSNFALFLSGVSMALCFMFSEIVISGARAFADARYANVFAPGRLAAQFDNSNLFNVLVTIAQLALFLGLFRLLPLSGYHAAEHQTVWAIERGLPLRPEIVKQMPRAHPRCGTNLVALSLMITIIFDHLPSTDSGTVLLALLFVFFAWRSFGTALQNHFTTRPASPKQLESGIKAGRELLEKYQQNPHEMESFAARLLNSGIFYSMAGAIGVTTILGYGMRWLAENYQSVAPFLGGF